MNIIGITGTIGAGKGTIVDYLVKEKGYVHYSVREFLAEEVKKRGLEVNRDTLTEVGNDLRAKHLALWLNLGIMPLLLVSTLLLKKYSLQTAP